MTIEEQLRDFAASVVEDASLGKRFGWLRNLTRSRERYLVALVCTNRGSGMTAWLGIGKDHPGGDR